MNWRKMKYLYIYFVSKRMPRHETLYSYVITNNIEFAEMDDITKFATRYMAK